MAVEVMTWVFANSRSKNAERLVMLAVADACNKPDGTGAWMSNAAMCAKTNLSERAVQTAVKGCERLGELKVERQAGRGGVNRFAVIMTAPKVTRNPAESALFTETPQNLHPAESAGVRTDDAPQAKAPNPADSAGIPVQRNPAESAPGTVKNSSTKSSKTRRATTSKDRGTRIPDDFQATEAMVAWARKETPNVGAKETEAFVDYWLAVPGQKGVKTNWPATWRNWMRRAQSDFEARQERASKYPINGSYAGRTPAPNSNAPRAIPADEKCPKHRGQRLGRCGPCRSETHGVRQGVVA